MIDIHTHVLPGIDDGSESMEMSLALIASALEGGTEAIIATPHCYRGVFDNYAGEELQKRWDALHRAVRRAGIPMHLYQGMEIMACDDLPELLKTGKVWTLNGTKYFLMEFEFNDDPKYGSGLIQRCIDAGYTPVIAHPARYYFVQDDPSIVYDWYRKGCAIQLNKGSLLGDNGRRSQQTAMSLLRHCVVSCVASDAHRTYWRNSDLGQVEEFLLDNFGEEYTYMLLEDNPDRILRGRRLVGYRPVPYDRQRSVE
ncbi:MAG: hypothetical protein IJJ24_11160 [Solobacterium sp.]|nr:hypothetical protein [Solobacterium sp.]MBR0479638.1 hypothetical protein [Solobacterium sp.]